MVFPNQLNNQFSRRNRGFLGGAFPRHEITPPGITPTPFPGPGTGGGRPGRKKPRIPTPGPGSPFQPAPPSFVTGPFDPTPGDGGASPGTPSGPGGGGGGFPSQEDFIKELFGQEPRLAFQGALARQRGDFTPIQREFFPTQFNAFENRFFGDTANRIQGGTSLADLPNFQDFLGGIDFQREFRSLPPSLRPGGSQARFKPPTQFQF